MISKRVALIVGAFFLILCELSLGSTFTSSTLCSVTIDGQNQTQTGATGCLLRGTDYSGYSVSASAFNNVAYVSGNRGTLDPTIQVNTLAQSYAPTSPVQLRAAANATFSQDFMTSGPARLGLITFSGDCFEQVVTYEGFANLCGGSTTLTDSLQTSSLHLVCMNPFESPTCETESFSIELGTAFTVTASVDFDTAIDSSLLGLAINDQQVAYFTLTELNGTSVNVEMVPEPCSGWLVGLVVGAGGCVLKRRSPL